MPRYTTNTTPQELEELIGAKLKGDVFSPQDLPAAVVKDLKKVSFDLGGKPLDVEGLSPVLGVQEIDVPHFLHKDKAEYRDATGKLVFFGALGGNENETPIFFILYQNYDGALRAYVPKQGNSWDAKKKSAKKAPADKEGLAAAFDVEAIRKDIASRIEFFGKADMGLSFIPDAKL